MYSARYYFIFLKTWAFCCCCFALHRFSSCPVCAWSTLFHQYFESPWALMRCIWWMKLLNYYPLYLRSHGGPVKLPLTKNGRGKKWSSFIKKKRKTQETAGWSVLSLCPARSWRRSSWKLFQLLWGPEQLDVVEGVPGYHGGNGIGQSLRSLPIQTVLCFCGSMTFCSFSGRMQRYCWTDGRDGASIWFSSSNMKQ